MSIFRPRMYQKNIFNIDYEKLLKKNIKMIIFDLDNTILEIDKDIPNKMITEKIKELSHDFKVVIASNNVEKRVKKVSTYLGCEHLYSIRKPSKKIKKFIDKRYGIPMENIAIIGDQIVTDIFMGNRLGMYTILVDPMEEKDLKVTYLNRFLEKRIMKRMKIKRGDYYEEE